MTHFPTEVFTNIMEFCGDSIKTKQRKLWNSISIKKIDKYKKFLMYKCNGKYKVLNRPRNGNGEFFPINW